MPYRLVLKVSDFLLELSRWKRGLVLSAIKYRKKASKQLEKIDVSKRKGMG